MSEITPSQEKQIIVSNSFKEWFIRTHIWDLLRETGDNGFGVRHAQNAPLVLQEIMAPPIKGRPQKLGYIVISSLTGLEPLGDQNKLRFEFYGKEKHWGVSVDSNNQLTDFDNIDEVKFLKAIGSLIRSIFMDNRENKLKASLRLAMIGVSKGGGEFPLPEGADYWGTVLNRDVFLGTLSYISTPERIGEILKTLGQGKRGVLRPRNLT